MLWRFHPDCQLINVKFPSLARWIHWMLQVLTNTTVCHLFNVFLPSTETKPWNTVEMNWYVWLYCAERNRNRNKENQSQVWHIRRGTERKSFTKNEEKKGRKNHKMKQSLLGALSTSELFGILTFAMAWRFAFYSNNDRTTEHTLFVSIIFFFYFVLFSMNTVATLPCLLLPLSNAEHTPSSFWRWKSGGFFFSASLTNNHFEW